MNKESKKFDFENVNISSRSEVNLYSPPKNKKRIYDVRD